MKRFALFLLCSYAVCQQLAANDGKNAGDVSFSPYKVHSTSKGDKGVIWVGSIASTFAPAILSGPLTPAIMAGLVSNPVGWVVSGILAAAVLIFATRNNISPDEMYQQLWGRIETQVNGAINAKSAAQMKDRLNTLSHNVHDQSVAYLSLMGISNTADIPKAPAPLISAHQVDMVMRPFDDILSVSNGWYSSTPVNLRNPDAFVLAKTDAGERRCLHTKNYNIDDGTELVVDSECKMDSLSDKMFAIEDGTQRLLMRTESGVKCVAYKDKNGKNYKKHLAIFNIFSKQCVDGVKITLRKNGEGFSIYDGDKMNCISSSNRKKNINAIISPSKRRKCLNNNSLIFKSMIPVALNPGSLTPAYSFDEIGIQLFYFPQFATFHLASLKEIYLYGTNKRGAQAQFWNKVKEYKTFLATYVPIFQAYNNYVGLGAEEQISNAIKFHSVLEKATLKYQPQQFQGIA